MTTCRRCGRALKSERSVNAEGGPIGPVCARRARIEATHKPEQVAKAVELVRDGGIVRVRPRSRVFAVTSGDGARTYLVGPRGCTCPHGRHAARRGQAATCYHTAARALRVA